MKIVQKIALNLENTIHDKGWFATGAAVAAAYPVGNAGDNAIIGNTKTVWIWDVGTAAWIDTAMAGIVLSVFSRTGTILAAVGDYTWAQIDKTTSDIADITTKSHTSLTDIGVKTHATLDIEVGLNNAKISYTDAAAVGLNTTHRTSAGTDHSDVGLNNTHRGSSGADHSYLDQSVVIASSPTFTGTNITGIPLDNLTNPSGNVLFSMANKQIKFTFQAPSVADGAFELEASGGFSGDLLHVHQHTGNPGVADLCHFEAADTDVTILRCSNAGGDILLLQNDGYLHVGGNTPTARLHVSGASNDYVAKMITVGTAAYGLLINATTITNVARDALNINTTDEKRFVVRAKTGDVGIGQATPLVQCHMTDDEAGEFVCKIEHIGGSVSRNSLLLATDGTSASSTILKMTLSGNDYEVFRFDALPAFTMWAYDHSDITARLYTSSDDGIFDIYQNNAVVNRIHGNGDSYITGGKMGFGIAAPLAQVHIDQAGSAAAIPVLTLDQADESEGTINFIASDRGVIGEGVGSAVSVRVELAGTVYRLALYADA